MLDHGPHPPRSREKKEIRYVSTFTAQHVRAATRSIKCERQWRHVALATAGPMLVANNMAAYPLRINNSVCPLRISNTCLMSVHTIYNHVKSIICYLCFMQHAWSCSFFFKQPSFWGKVTEICLAASENKAMGTSACEVNCTLLGHYAASIGYILPTFRNNLTVLSSRFKNPFLIRSLSNLWT